MKKVAVVMGADGDLPVMEPAIKKLGEFGIPVSVRVLSAHRTPAAAEEFARNARANGFAVIIAAAGKAAHLAGVLAGLTTLPVIGVPIKSSFMDGLDSLLSIVQMPTGIPVATVAVNAAENAAILAAQILGVQDTQIEDKLAAAKMKMESDVLEKDRKISLEYSN